MGFLISFFRLLKHTSEDTLDARKHYIFPEMHMAQARTRGKSKLKQLIDVTAVCIRYPLFDVTISKASQ